MKLLMMKPERLAGIFLVAVGGAAIASICAVGLRQGWFERKVEFVVHATTGSDLRQGTRVEVQGLPVGKVSELELGGDGKVKIKLGVRMSYANLVTVGTTARITRPLFVGEKTIELIPEYGSRDLANPGTELALVESTDPISLIKGNSLNEGINKFYSLLSNLDNIARQANRKNQLEHAVENVAVITRELKVALPHYTRNAAEMSGQVAEITRNLNNIAARISDLMPTLQEMAKSAPETAKALNESLSETRVLVKALQRNFLIRGHVQDIKEEESKVRKPSGTSEQAPQRP